MAFLLCKKFDNQTRYYKCYNGKRPITAGRLDAARLDRGTADKVLAQLGGLGHSDWKIMDETERLK